MTEAYDASDKKQIGEKKNKQRLAIEAEANRLSFMMNSEIGRAFMHDLLTKAHVFQSSFSPDSERVTCFREGERNIGLRYFAKIQEGYLDKYMLMVEEFQKREGK